MTRTTRILLAGATFVALGVGAAAYQKAQAATSNMTVDAVLIAPVTITCGTNLDFGTMISGTAATVTISTAGARSDGGAGVLVGAGGQEGACTVTGANTYVVDVSIPATTVTDGTDTMNVNTFLIRPTGAGADVAIPGSYTLDGTDDFTVGANLVIAGTEGAGTYTGTAAVTIDYQ